jgi:hypothetical protein
MEPSYTAKVGALVSNLMQATKDRLTRSAASADELIEPNQYPSVIEAAGRVHQLEVSLQATQPRLPQAVWAATGQPSQVTPRVIGSTQVSREAFRPSLQRILDTDASEVRRGAALPGLPQPSAAVPW